MGARYLLCAIIAIVLLINNIRPEIMECVSRIAKNKRELVLRVQTHSLHDDPVSQVMKEK